MNFKKTLSLALIFTMLFSTALFAEPVRDFEIVNKHGKQIENTNNLLDIVSKDEKVRVIVELEDEPGLAYVGSGEKYIDLPSSTRRNIESDLLSQQEAVINNIISTGIEFDTLSNYTVSLNGFSGFVRFSDIDRILKNRNVKNVYISQEYERPVEKPDMKTSWEFIESHSVWQSVPGYKGEGMVAAVVDTGIDPSHKDMNISEGTEVSLKEENVTEQGLPGDYYTTKVPYGYNYFDHNDIILDIGPDASEHGMHVAGTVGANGDIKGVAPECQLLAMKVFSNDPKFPSTYTDIYLEAIEDAVKLGVDAINMSLGSTASFYDEEDIMNKVITDCREKGIIFSISAGNSAQFGNMWDLPYRENPDIGVVGAPGLNRDSISVAASGNVQYEYKHEVIIGGGNGEVPDELLAGMPSMTYIVEDVAYSQALVEKPGAARNHLVNVCAEYENELDKAPVYVKIDSSFYNAALKRVSKSQIPAVTYKDEKGNVVQYAAGDGPAIVGSSIFGYSCDDWSDVPSENGEIEIVTLPEGKKQAQPDDFEGIDVAGKVVLAIRGGNPFVTKATNAAIAGATGIIIYDNKVAPQVPYTNVGGSDIPLMIITNADGLKIEEAIAAENNIAKYNEEDKKDGEDMGKMVDFTSWGTTPTLELKPEITAPGGMIYSTLQNDNYGYMSGTSMAAPHVTGGSALVLQYLKAKGVEESNLSEMAKILLMNTAEMIRDKYDLPFSPRRQGAGMMKLRKAIDSPVVVYSELSGQKEAKVELKDFTSKMVTFTLTVENLSDTAHTYDIDVDVLADYIVEDSGIEYNALSSDILEGASVEELEPITLEANESKTFDISIDITDALVPGLGTSIEENMFIEGFVKLTPVNEDIPELSIPYVGFYGDWTGEEAPKIFDGMEVFGDKSFYGIAGLINEKGQYLGYNPAAKDHDKEKIALSPGKTNSDNKSIIPVVSLLRNSEDTQFRILDKDGNELRTIYTEQYMRKHYFDGKYARYAIVSNAVWDGMLKGKAAPEGKYYYEIRGKVQGENAAWQSIKIPVMVDVTPPEIKDMNYNKETTDLKWKAIDNLSGVNYFEIYLNDENLLGEDMVIVYSSTVTEYKLNIKEELGKEIPVDATLKLRAYDFAGNYIEEVLSSINDTTAPAIYLTYPDVLEFAVDEIGKSTNVVTVSGYVLDESKVEEVLIELENEEDNPVVVKTTFDEKIEHELDDGTKVIVPGYRFERELTELSDGVHFVKVSTKDPADNEMGIRRGFYVDITPPELTIDGIPEGAITDSEVTLNINMKDNFPILKMYVDDSEVFSCDELEQGRLHDPQPIEKDKEVILKLELGENNFVITLIDAVGNKDIKKITINREEVAKSSDATLATLMYGDIEIDLGEDKFNYEIELPSETIEAPQIYAEACNENAEVQITQATALEDGSNVATIVVTAEDGTTTTYTVTFN